MQEDSDYEPEINRKNDNTDYSKLVVNQMQEAVIEVEPTNGVTLYKFDSNTNTTETILSNLDYVSPELIAQLDDVLKTELSTLGSIDTQQLGGVEPIADMLNMMDKNSEKNVMARVEEKDPELAEEIRKLMFVFEDIIFVDDKGKEMPYTAENAYNLVKDEKLLKFVQFIIGIAMDQDSYLSELDETSEKN